MPKSQALAKNWLTDQEKASFLIILTKSVEPIFQSAGPNSRHTTLEGTLPIKLHYIRMHFVILTEHFNLLVLVLPIYRIRSISHPGPLPKSF